MNNTILRWHRDIRAAYRKLSEVSRDFIMLEEMIAHALTPKDPRLTLDRLGKLMRVGLREPAGMLKVVIEKENPARPRWLKRVEIELLLALVGNFHNATTMRNRAMIGLSSCTAVRRDELMSVHFEDLTERTKQGKLGLFVRNPKRTSRGIIKRTVPYGQLDYGLRWALEWARLAKISSGPLWVRTYGNIAYNNKPIIDADRINEVLAQYPLGKTKDGEDIIVTNHTLRRTYARMQAIGPLNEETGEYDKPMPVEEIMELMGHASVDMTQENYIGTGWKGIEPQFVYGPEMEERIEELKATSEYTMAVPTSKGRWHKRIMAALSSAPRRWFFLYEVIEPTKLSRQERGICNTAANTLEKRGEIWQFKLKQPRKYQRSVVAKPGTQPFLVNRDRRTGQKSNEFKPTKRTLAMIEEMQKEDAQNR